MSSLPLLLTGMFQSGRNRNVIPLIPIPVYRLSTVNFIRYIENFPSIYYLFMFFIFSVRIVLNFITVLLLWWPKSAWEGKGLFCLHFHITVRHQRNSRQELKAKLMQDPKGMWLACLLLMACELPAQGWHHSQWPGTSHINRQSRKITTALSTGQPRRAFFLNRDFLF